MVNWSSVLESKNNQNEVLDFARGNTSARTVLKNIAGTDGSRELRRVIALEGVHRTRYLARKALQRRGLTTVV